MIQVQKTQTYPISPSEGFAYITDVNNWRNYWPDFVRIQDPANARWSKSGDTVTLDVRLLNRERELTMILEEFKCDLLVTYLSRQTGLPDAHHERHFRAVRGGFEYRMVVTFVPRAGIVGLFDRTLVRIAVTQALRKTHQNLDSIFRQWQPMVTANSVTIGD